MKSSNAVQPDLAILQERIDYQFKDLSLLELAMTHESYSNENGLEGISNERLEFLGDSVLGMTICAYLYEKHPKEPEGHMAQVKGFIASTAYLAEKARGLHLGEFLRMGRGETHSGGGSKSNVLADATEALIGAMYLDGGFEPAKKFILSLLKTAMDNMEGAQRDYKSLLQEYVQKTLHILPSYKVVREEGPSHDRVFGIEVLLDGEVLGRGEGRSKQIAGQGAAEQALTLLKRRTGMDLDLRQVVVQGDEVL